MFVIFKIINLLLRKTNTLKKKLLIGIFLDFKNLDPRFLNTPKISSFLTGLKKTIEKIGAISETVVMLAFVDLDVQASLQPLKSI